MSEVISQNRIFRRATWIGAASLALLAPPGAALADRPGTPNNERAWSCNDRNSEPPAVCVEFNNTASEPVRFDIEYTVNGEKVISPRPKAQAIPEFQPGSRHCIGCSASKFVAAHESEAAMNFNLGSNHEKPTRGKTGSDNGSGDPLGPQGFMIPGLDYGTTYCFRFKARRASDDMVSEQWSNWACTATDGSPPPKPGKLEPLFVEYTPGGRDWRTKPPKVVITWGGSLNAASYVVSKAGWSKTVDATEAREVEYFPTEGDFGSNESNPSIVFRVCARNISGESCAQKSTFVPPGDAVGIPRIPIGGLSVPSKPGIDSNRNVPVDTVGRPGAAADSVSRTNASTTSSQSTACSSGFVWRKANADDRICVTPQARSRVAQENADSANHVDPAGAYGPNTCVSGYVWRNAFDGDGVCVTPQARDLASRENAESASHRVH